jgi:hypothetical protein
MRTRWKRSRITVGLLSAHMIPEDSSSQPAILSTSIATRLRNTQASCVVEASHLSVAYRGPETSSIPLTKSPSGSSCVTLRRLTLNTIPCSLILTTCSLMPIQPHFTFPAQRSTGFNLPARCIPSRSSRDDQSCRAGRPSTAGLFLREGFVCIWGCVYMWVSCGILCVDMEDRGVWGAWCE